MLIHIPYMEHTVWDILYPHLSPSTTLPGRPFCFCCSQRVQRGNWPGGPWLWSIKNWGWWICPCTMFCSYKKLKPWTPTEHSFWIQHVCFSHRGENHSHKNKQTNALYSYTTYHNFWSSVVLSFQSRNTGTIRDTKTASIQNSSMPGDHGKSSSKMCILLSCGETQCVAPWLPMLPHPQGNLRNMDTPANRSLHWLHWISSHRGVPELQKNRNAGFDHVEQYDFTPLVLSMASELRPDIYIYAHNIT